MNNVYFLYLNGFWDKLNQIAPLGIHKISKFEEAFWHSHHFEIQKKYDNSPAVARRSKEYPELYKKLVNLPNVIERRTRRASSYDVPRRSNIVALTNIFAQGIGTVIVVIYTNTQAQKFELITPILDAHAVKLHHETDIFNLNVDIEQPRLNLAVYKLTTEVKDKSTWFDNMLKTIEPTRYANMMRLITNYEEAVYVD